MIHNALDSDVSINAFRNIQRMQIIIILSLLESFFVKAKVVIQLI